MKAVILAAGLGTRLQPIIGNDKPKVMLEYGEKPLLHRTIDILREKGFKEIIIVVSAHKDKIIDYFGDGEKLGVRIDYVEQQNPKGGTADAVKCVKEKINDEKFLLIYGDNVFSPDILEELLKKENFDGVLCSKEVEDPRNFGVLHTEGELVKKIIEKPENPPTNLALTGLFVMPKEIFSAIEETKISPRGELELTDSIQILIDKGHKLGFVNASGYWFDPGDENEIEKARHTVEQNQT